MCLRSLQVGKMRQLLELWPVARVAYRRLTKVLQCPRDAADHSHCRNVRKPIRVSDSSALRLYTHAR